MRLMFVINKIIALKQKQKNIVLKGSELEYIWNEV